MEFCSKTNVGKQFLRIIDISFPQGNPLRKLLNRITVKVLYKCMPNMNSVVSSHNTKLLQKETNQQQVEGCNCQGGPGTCPLTPAECQKKNVIYVASVSSAAGVEHYTGLTSNTLKKQNLRSAQKSRPISAIWRLRVRGRVKSVVTLRGTHKQT